MSVRRTNDDVGLPSEVLQRRAAEAAGVEYEPDRQKRLAEERDKRESLERELAEMNKLDQQIKDLQARRKELEEFRKSGELPSVPAKSN